MGLFNSSAARLARSVVDWRLNGLPVRATTSQAMDTMTALSRGGKDGLAASPRGIFKSKLPLSPPLPPEADGVRVKVEAGGCGRVGKRRAVMQQEDQLGALAEVGGCRPCPHEAQGLGEEVVGETGA